MSGISGLRANAFSSGLLAGYGFVDTLFQRRRQIDLQERETARIGRLDAENNRRYEIDQARQREIDELNREEINERRNIRSQGLADIYQDRYAFGKLADTGFKLDALAPTDREFFMQRAATNPTLANFLNQDIAERQRVAAEGRARVAAAAERQRMLDGFEQARRVLSGEADAAAAGPAALPQAPRPPTKTELVMSPANGADYDALPGPNPDLMEPPAPLGYAGPEAVPDRPALSSVLAGLSSNPSAPAVGVPLYADTRGRDGMRRDAVTQEQFWPGVARNDKGFEKYRADFEANPYKMVRNYGAVRASLSDDARKVSDPFVAKYARQTAEAAATKLRGLDPKDPEFRTARRELDVSTAVLANAAKTPITELTEIRALAVAPGTFDARSPRFLETVAQVAMSQDSPYPYAEPGAVRSAVTTVSRLPVDAETFNNRQMQALGIAMANGVPAAAITALAKQYAPPDPEKGVELSTSDGMMGVRYGTTWAPIRNLVTGRPLIDEGKRRKIMEEWPKERLDMVDQIVAANPINGDITNDRTDVLATLRNNADMIQAAYGIDLSDLSTADPTKLATVVTNAARWLKYKRVEDNRFFWRRWTGGEIGSTGDTNLVNYNSGDGATARIEVPRTQQSPEMVRELRQQIMRGEVQATPEMYRVAMLGEKALADELERQTQTTANRAMVLPP